MIFGLYTLVCDKMKESQYNEYNDPVSISSRIRNSGCEKDKQLIDRCLGD